MAAGLEIRGEPLAGVAVVHNERGVAVCFEEIEETRTVGVGGEVERLNGCADLEVPVADLDTAGLEDPATRRPLDLLAPKETGVGRVDVALGEVGDRRAAAGHASSGDDDRRLVGDAAALPVATVHEPGVRGCPRHCVGVSEELRVPAE